MDRLEVASFLAACILLPSALDDIASRHAAYHSVSIDGGQAVMAGLTMVAMGIYAGWSCYLKRAITLFPDWAVRLRLIAVILLLILALPAMVRFVPWSSLVFPVVFLGSMVVGVVVGLLIHRAIKNRIRKEADQHPEALHSAPAARPPEG